MCSHRLAGVNTDPGQQHTIEPLQTGHPLLSRQGATTPFMRRTAEAVGLRPGCLDWPHLQEMAQQVAQVAEAGIGGVLHRLQALLPAELRQLAAPEPQQGPHQGYPRPPAAPA